MAQPINYPPLHKTIYIIESPKDKDLLVGRLEGNALKEALTLAENECFYQLATSKETFINAFENVLSTHFLKYKRIILLCVLFIFLPTETKMV